VLTNVEVRSAWSSAPDVPLSVGVGEDEDPLQIRGIDGLGPVKATINTTQKAQRGAFKTGSSTPARNVVLTIGFNPDYVEHTVSSLREKLYGYFMPEQPVNLRIFRDDKPAVEIDGFSEGVDPTIFSKDPEVQISVICPDPDFVAVAASIVEGTANHEPVSVDFTALSNIATSALLEITALEGDETTYDGTITFEKKTLASGAEIFTVTGTVGEDIVTRIDSRQGDKIAQVDYGVETTNILNSMTDDSVWPRITPGTNKIKVILEAAAADKHWKLTYFDRFGGL